MRGKLQLNLIQQVFTGYLLTMLLSIKLLRFHGSGRISKKGTKRNYEILIFQWDYNLSHKYLTTSFLKIIVYRIRFSNILANDFIALNLIIALTCINFPNGFPLT